MSELAINTGSSQPIIENLQLQGFQFHTRMEISLPDLPDDITALGDEDLMEYFNKYTAYSNFLETQHACAVIDEKNAESALDLEESKAYLALHEQNKKETVTLIKAKLATNPDIIYLRESLAAKYAYRKLIEVMVNNMQRSTFLVSREVTRRKGGDNGYIRSQRMFP